MNTLNYTIFLFFMVKEYCRLRLSWFVEIYKKALDEEHVSENWRGVVMYHVYYSRG